MGFHTIFFAKKEEEIAVQGFPFDVAKSKVHSSSHFGECQRSSFFYLFHPISSVGIPHESHGNYSTFPVAGTGNPVSSETDKLHIFMKMPRLISTSLYGVVCMNNATKASLETTEQSICSRGRALFILRPLIEREEKIRAAK